MTTPLRWRSQTVLSFIFALHGSHGCYWFGIQAERTYNEYRWNGRNVRTAIFSPIEGGNHFAHWDMPQMVMEALAFGIHNDSAIV
ncbi:hypothetical protein E4T56_gene7296 [Termitomyces sp. T112]|nr:hypothetical protein E4T56_gene7296 [Termitomyces sp. T112]